MPLNKFIRNTNYDRIRKLIILLLNRLIISSSNNIVYSSIFSVILDTYVLTKPDRPSDPRIKSQNSEETSKIIYKQRKPALIINSPSYINYCLYSFVLH